VHARFATPENGVFCSCCFSAVRVSPAKSQAAAPTTSLCVPQGLRRPEHLRSSHTMLSTTRFVLLALAAGFSEANDFVDVTTAYGVVQGVSTPQGRYFRCVGCCCALPLEYSFAACFDYVCACLLLPATHPPAAYRTRHPQSATCAGDGHETPRAGMEPTTPPNSVPTATSGPSQTPTARGMAHGGPSGGWITCRRTVCSSTS